MMLYFSLHGSKAWKENFESIIRWELVGVRFSVYTGCPKIYVQFEMAGMQSVFKIFSKTQKSDHHKIWPFYKLLGFLKSVVK